MKNNTTAVLSPSRREQSNEAVPSKDTPKSITPESFTVGPVFYVNDTSLLSVPSTVLGNNIVSLNKQTPLNEEVWQIFSNLIDVQQSSVDNPETSEANQEESETDATNRVRIELLARQYESKKLSSEQEARLAILTQRMHRLAPRVTEKDFRALEEIMVNLKKLNQENIETRRKLQID